MFWFSHKRFNVSSFAVYHFAKTAGLFPNDTVEPALRDGIPGAREPSRQVFNIKDRRATAVHFLLNFRPDDVVERLGLNTRHATVILEPEHNGAPV